MIVPDETIHEMMQDISTMSQAVLVVLKNVQPRENADLQAMLAAADRLTDRLKALVMTLKIVAEENSAPH